MIRARLMGELQVEVNGQPIARFRTRKAALLLAYLLRYPQRHSRQHLLRLFWNSMPTAAAQNNLRVVLAMLRRLLEPPGIPAGSILQTTRRWVGLNPELIETDVAAFEDALQQAANAIDPAERRRWLEHACTLYTGDFLAEFDDPWVQAERERLRRLYDDALQQLPSAETLASTTTRDPITFTASNPPCGLGMVLGLENEAPLERLRGWARQVIVASGGFVLEATATGIRAFFSSLEGLLKTLDILHQQLKHSRFALDAGELRYALGRYGGLPLQTVEQLVQLGSAQQILCTERAALLLPQARTGARFTLHHLGYYRLSERGGNTQVYQLDFVGREQLFAPLRALSPLRMGLMHVPTSFIGREKELTQLQAWLQGGKSRLISIVGAPGVGKSRLALELAWWMEPLFGEARWWITLHNRSESVAEVLTRRLGWEWQGLEPLVNALSGALGGQPALLVIDGATTLSERQAAELIQLLEKGKGLHLVVASQAPLDIIGEHLFLLEPLPVPPEGMDEIEALLRYASVRLFIERARQVLPDFQLTARNAAEIAILCRQLEGLPLAIELAAARVGNLSLSEMHERLRHSIEWLSRRPTGTIGHTLQASLQASFQLLSPALRAFFARLSVFRGGFTQEAAQAVASPPDASEALQELTRLSLVQPEGERNRPKIFSDPPREKFRLLEPVRLFAERQLKAVGEIHKTREAHLRYYLELTEHGNDMVASWELLEAERANIEAALTWATERSPDRALRLAAALSSFWERRGSGQSVYQLVCQLPKRLPETEQQLQAARMAINLAIRRGEMTQAQQLLEQFLPLTYRVPDSPAAARLWTAAGFYYWMQGECECSITYLQRAIQRFQAFDALLDRAEALNHIGVALWIRGELSSAACALEEALELTPPNTAQMLRMKIMSNLANVLYQMGLQEQAEAYLAATLQLAQQLGDRRTEATLLNNWSVWLRERGEYARARELCLQANTIWQELHEGIGEAAALNNLADIAMHESDYESATTLFHRGLERVLRYRLFWYLPQVLQNLAELTERQGMLDEAIRWQSARLFVSLYYEQPNQVAPALRALAQLALKSGDPLAAARWLLLMEPITGEPCPDTLQESVQSHLPAEMLESLCQEVRHARREQLIEQLRPLTKEMLTPFCEALDL